jgi:pyruvate formate lyase activating enzyme
MAPGMVFDIQRFSIHDGPGIRTTVFLKGCPLHCLWCHNPEGQSPEVEIFFSPEKCIACRYCEQVCRHAGHSFLSGQHVYDRSQCVQCGDCTLECYARALEQSGRLMSASDVLGEVLKDAVFYQTSSGGMTLSGGEPMQQFDFALELLQAAKAAGLHTCLETSGCSTGERYLRILPHVDVFYYDCKETDAERHRQYTGVSSQGIIENLMILDQAGAATVLRCPIVPGLNDRQEHFQGIANLANRLRHLEAVHILPYHPLGTSKSQRLGKIPPLAEIGMPSEAQAREWAAAVQALASADVMVG